MSSEAAEQKDGVRRQVRWEVKRLSAAARAAGSAHVCSAVQQDRQWREAKVILLYVALGNELDVSPMLRDGLSSGRTIAIPAYDPLHGLYVPRQVKDPAVELEIGIFGVVEPKPACPVVPPNRLDFAIIPGVAFTLEGRRVGRGKGHYDRLLALVAGVKCGVAFDEQIVEAIPTESHDVRMDWIVTPTRFVRLGGSGAGF